MRTRFSFVLVIAAAVFLALHLVALPRTLEDIDSVNLALGVESFDVPRHQPHPPGYPVFIALAKGSTAALEALAPSLDRDRRAAVAMAIWNVLAGALAVIVFHRLWIAIGFTEATALLASIIAVASPLFWLTASRPLTDTIGLVVAVAVQAAFILGFVRERSQAEVPARFWLWSSVCLGFVAGLRSQTLWLTVPGFLLAAGVLLFRRRIAPIAAMAAAVLSGALIWAVPLIRDSGGWQTYSRAVESQGREDLTGVELLATRPSASLLSDGLERTFIAPWYEETIAHVVLGLAIIGFVGLLRRQRRTLGLLVVAFTPYLLFHLAFQETATTRYALPLIVPVAGLAASGLMLAGVRVAVFGTAVIVVASLYFVHPQLVTYAREGSPVFRAFQDMQAKLRTEANPPLVHMHHQVWLGLRRAAEWYRSAWDVGLYEFPGDREWLTLVDYWRGGHQRSAWVLTDPKRNDMALFDWRARVLGGRYVWGAELRSLIGGTRLEQFNWWRLDRPFWMLGRGWSVTPEIAGMTAKDGLGPAVQPADAFLRRDPRAANVVVGGRYLRGSGPAVVSVSLDGRPIDEWTLSTGPGEFFVRWIPLPVGALDGVGPYATLSVSVRSPGNSAGVPVVGLEQFDAAVEGETISALHDGWYEPEGNPGTGTLWRWMSGQGSLRVRTAAPEVRLTLAGESPLRYFDAAPEVVVRVGAHGLLTFSPTGDFEEAVTIPADVLAEANGEILIQTSRTFSPIERGESADPRRLGLRIYRVEIR